MEAILLNKQSLVSRTGSNYVKSLFHTGEKSCEGYCWDGSMDDLPLYSCFSYDETMSKGFLNLSNVHRVDDIPKLAAYKPRIISKEYYRELTSSLLNSFNFSSEEQACLQTLFIECFNDYSTRYAATKCHHAYKGGLLTHVVELLEAFYSLKDFVYVKSADPFVIIVSSLLHDYGKLEEYDSEGIITDSYFSKGHVYMSALYAAKTFLKRFPNIPLKQKDNVIHCILSHHGKTEYGSPVVPCTIEAFIVSKLDELSGFGYQFNIEGNTFTYNDNKVKVLNLH